jgi:DNA-binding transcriptional LysR family regulator
LEKLIMVSLRQIRYFIAVAEGHSMTAAARAMRISQSAITLAIKDLEAGLGVALLERQTGGVRLTLEGHQFLYHARNVESSVTDAIQSIRRDTLSIEGDLAVGVTYTVAGYFLFPILARFRRMFPGIRLRLEEGVHQEVERKVVDGELDCAVMLKASVSERSPLVFRPLMRTERRLWLSSGHALLARERVTLQDVAAEPYVMLVQDVVEQTTLGYWSKVGLTPNVVFRTSSLEAVRSMVATGAGVSILSDIAYRPWSVDGSRVEARSVDFPIPRMIIGMVSARRARLSRAGRLFNDFFVDAVR